MNKSAIQRFAIWARTELIDRVSQRAYQYDITEDGFGDPNAKTVAGRPLTPEEERQRRELVEQIRQKGYAQVMEEVAYTWFNRFIALRFLEVNNYLPSHTRVFSDSTGLFKPEILDDAMHLELPGLDKSKVLACIEENRTEDLYRYLLLTQCNALNEALPGMFERMGGYTEMLLPDNILRQDSVLGRMVSDIPEEDWLDAVQIIGWLYQYYNTELKDDTFAQLKKNVKITKERIPAATQLFTPDWIVRYMVENSLSRIFISRQLAVVSGQEGAVSEEARIAKEKAIAEKMGWKYYLPEAAQTPEVRATLDRVAREQWSVASEKSDHASLTTDYLTSLRVIDPCMGSGHILVYAFDVLMQIYIASGWEQREAAQSILRNNLYGLDIDNRAAQLAYFAVMMKARQYDRRLFSRGIQPNLYAIRESNGIPAMAVEYFHHNDPKLKADITRIVAEMRDAKEYGSILSVTPVDFGRLYARFDEISDDINIMRAPVLDDLLPLVKCAELLAQKYDVVVTNPPYMAVSNAGAKVNNYVKENFPDSKADMFAVFIERCGQMVKKNGYQAMITQHAWMFLSSFEKLRTKLLAVDIVNMAHLGARAFEEIGGEVVQTTSFVIWKSHIMDYKGEYCRLIEPTTQQGKENMFLAGENRYAADQSNFSKIPGSPVAYWLSISAIRTFANKSISDYGMAQEGIKTGDNERFLRMWYEVNLKKTNIITGENKKWIKTAKAGEHRRWYGSHYVVTNFLNEGEEIIASGHGSITGKNNLYKEAISWNRIATNHLAFRKIPIGFISNMGGLCLYPYKTSDFLFLLAYLNTKVAEMALNVINPTMSFPPGTINSLGCQENLEYSDKIRQKASDCVDMAKADWNSTELSWDFKRNPLV